MKGEKLMEVKMLYEIEKNGIIATIQEYSTENFINSYCNKLKELDYPKDKEMIKTLITKLFTWYDEGSIDEALQCDYEPSRRKHIYTYRVLRTLVKELNPEYEKPKKRKIKKKDNRNPFDNPILTELLEV